MSADTDTLKKLFPGAGLDTISYREVVDNLVDKTWTAFDLTIASKSRPFFKSDDMKVGVAYFPAGPVLKGVQEFRAGGQALVLRQLLVKRGAELVVATDGVVDLEVTVAPAGQGTKPADLPTEVVKKAAEGAGAALVLGLLGLGIFFAVKSGGGAK